MSKQAKDSLHYSNNHLSLLPFSFCSPFVHLSFCSRPGLSIWLYTSLYYSMILLHRVHYSFGAKVLNPAFRGRHVHQFSRISFGPLTSKGGILNFSLIIYHSSVSAHWPPKKNFKLFTHHLSVICLRSWYQPFPVYDLPL